MMTGQPLAHTEYPGTVKSKLNRILLEAKFSSIDKLNCWLHDRLVLKGEIQRRAGNPPLQSELLKSINARSTTTVSMHLKAMADMNLIHRLDNSHRAIAICKERHVPVIDMHGEIYDYQKCDCSLFSLPPHYIVIMNEDTQLGSAGTYVYIDKAAFADIGQTVVSLDGKTGQLLINETTAPHKLLQLWQGVVVGTITPLNNGFPSDR
jgi:hypothetical protein